MRLDRAQIEAARRAVAAWHSEVVRPLRAVRRRLKSAVDDCAPSAMQSALRARIQTIEIHAEHIEQLRLAAFADGFRTGTETPDPALALGNMATYLSSLDAGEETRAALETVAAAACRSVSGR